MEAGGSPLRPVEGLVLTLRRRHAHPRRVVKASRPDRPVPATARSAPERRRSPLNLPLAILVINHPCVGDRDAAARAEAGLRASPAGRGCGRWSPGRRRGRPPGLADQEQPPSVRGDGGRRLQRCGEVEAWRRGRRADSGPAQVAASVTKSPEETPVRVKAMSSTPGRTRRPCWRPTPRCPSSRASPAPRA